MFSVMCCGCQRLLSRDGKLIGPSLTDSGKIDFAQLIKRLGELRAENLAEFKNDEECDNAALAAGWTVKDPDGTPNHRCPECRIHVSAPERTGAYIDWGSA
jgi:hypothetical protein